MHLLKNEHFLIYQSIINTSNKSNNNAFILFITQPIIKCPQLSQNMFYSWLVRIEIQKSSTHYIAIMSLKALSTVPSL